MRFTTTELAIPGVLLIAPRRFADARGSFTETYRANEFAEIGIARAFVQDNLAVSASAGTVRGLHFQKPPHAQAKLVRVSRGAVYDVAVDVRAGSATYGRWVGVRLQADGKQLFIPRGCAHGYCSLEPDTEIVYKCDAYYAAEAEGGIHFADPAIGIAWPVDPRKAIVSDKDRALPPLSALRSPFAMELC
jgi:dTDP-4-dehydrorhamnose 3,5-epimerase